MDNNALQEKEFNRRIEQLESLLDEIGNFADPDVQAKTAQIVQTLLEFHGAALGRMLEHMINAGDAARGALAAMADDPLVASLLQLHNLHPLSLQSRVERALEGVRPYLATHGGNVQLLEVTADAVVRLRLEGSCHGCASSQATLKGYIEEAIYAAAMDVAAIEVEGAVEEHPAPDGFVPLSKVSVIHSGV